MNFSEIVGNDPIKGYLKRMVERNALAQSLLFAGPDGIGKSLFATALARLVLGKDLSKAGTHPDLFIYKPEGKIGLHSIDSMRHLSEEVFVHPYESSRKVFVIHDADRMYPHSANALLKTFEEPAPHSIIILLSSRPQALLPTILSRCRVVYFHAVPEEAIAQLVKEKWGISSEEAPRVAAMAQGSVGRAFRIAAMPTTLQARGAMLQFLIQGKVAVYSELKKAAADIAKEVEQTNQQLEAELREEIKKTFPEKPTAMQSAEIEKEIEGILAMRLVLTAQDLFEVIFSWYRDLHLLQLGGSRQHIIHRDCMDQCQQALERGHILPLESVQKHLEQSLLSLERFTSLSNCLENLFLHLNLL